MKIAIVYYSKHHENTKQLIDAIEKTQELALFDVMNISTANLEEYDLIGFASGIYFSGFQKGILEFAKNNLPEGKKVFFLYTCGSKKDGYTKTIREVVQPKRAEIVGEYGCRGFDTFGPFKLIGGIAKGHPNQDELSGTVSFFDSISK